MKKVTISWIFFVVLSSFVCYADSQKDEATVEAIPEWIRVGKPIRGSQIPETDYRYLAAWLDKHAKPAHQYIIDLFEKHQVVIIGEFHHIKEQKDFVLDLIPRLYHEAGVRCIGWEFSRHTDNEQLEKLVTAREFDREAALQFARDQLTHEWNSKQHWDFIERIWQLNNSLKPAQERMRLVGLDMDIDFTQFFVVAKSKPQDSPEFKEILTEVLKRDETMAEQVEKEIIDKGQKGLVFVGRCHDFTHYDFPPDMAWGRDIMGRLLYKKFADRIFQVGLGPNMLPVIERVMELRSHKPIGFDLYKSPFGNIRAPKEWSDVPGVPFSKLARGYVYLGSRADLHKNTAIKGFITDAMFKQYRQYYETDFGQSFKDATEVDRYLQRHRWPQP
jgi:uncharacterized iron-regulated protein